VKLQVDCFQRHSGQVYNVGGGPGCSISLAELTELCTTRTRNRLVLGSDLTTRPVDIPYYVTDSNKVRQATGWSPSRTVETTLDEVLDWLGRQRATLEPLLA